MEELSPPKARLPSFLKLFSRIKLNFYRIHLFYFLFTVLISSVIVYGSTANGNSGDAEKEFHLRYVDALYLTTSAMTNTGLNVVNLASVTYFQQAVVFILVPMGNAMFVSTPVLYVRRYWFRKKMNHFLQHSKAGRAMVDDIERQESEARADKARRDNETDKTPLKNFNSDSVRRRRGYGEYHLNAHGGFPFPWQARSVQNMFHASFRKLHRPPHDEPHSYLTFQPHLDHKGRFHSLDDKQKAELGGAEYRALTLLGWLLPACLLSWFCLGIIILVPYSYHGSDANIIRTSQPGNLEPGW